MEYPGDRAFPFKRNFDALDAHAAQRDEFPVALQKFPMKHYFGFVVFISKRLGLAVIERGPVVIRRRSHRPAFRLRPLGGLFPLPGGPSPFLWDHGERPDPVHRSAQIGVLESPFEQKVESIGENILHLEELIQDPLLSRATGSHPFLLLVSNAFPCKPSIDGAHPAMPRKRAALRYMSCSISSGLSGSRRNQSA